MRFSKQKTLLQITVATIGMFSFNSLNAQSGCTDPYATNYDSTAKTNDGSCTYPSTHATPVLKGYFSSSIPESSGLVFTDGKLWTHNDSGNPAQIFSVDTTDGHTLQTLYIDNYPNVDWEDITADSNYIYIGDHGNNNGTRKDLKILKILKSDIGAGAVVHVNAQAINFSYTDQTSFTSSSTHNFDCESLISIDTSLYIFTKDRGDLKTRVYRMPKTPGTYALTPYTSYNVNGLLTGADYNPVTKEIALIGYFSGHSNSFMWFLNDYTGDMFFSGNKRRIEIGNGTEWQTEGVCYQSDGRLFISCESAGSINASLYYLNKDWNRKSTSVTLLTNAKQYLVYPNPTTSDLYIKGEIPSKIIVSDCNGKILKKIVNNSRVSLQDVAAGSYFLDIYDKAGERVQRETIVKD